MQLLIEHAQRFGWEITPQQAAAFHVYSRELAAWNERVNLTAISQIEAVQIKHFLDSLTCLLALPPGDSLRVIDVGSGAGFPGLPLKIVRPDLRLTLLESTGKKTAFLEQIVQRLELQDVEVIQGRAEDLGQQAGHREAYDVAFARAVAELRVLLEYSLPFCRIGGRVIAQKRAGIEQEQASAAQAIAVLGGALCESISVTLPDLEPRQLILIDKVRPTPPAYPRRAGLPAKRPL